MHKLAESTKPGIIHIFTLSVRVSLQDHVYCGLMHLKSNMVHMQQGNVYLYIFFKLSGDGTANPF